MKIFSAEQLYEADKTTLQNQNLSAEELMERAGQQVFQWIHHHLKGANVPIRIFCGIGDNGGDGLVVGRHLVEHGYNVTVYVVNCSDKRSKNFLLNYDKIKNVTKNWPILMTGEDDFPPIDAEDIIVDAIFGIGLNRCPGGWVKKLIQYLNENGNFILSIDIPSGLYPNTPIEDSEAIIAADHTLTFQWPKLAFFLPETAPFVPSFGTLDIGLVSDFPSNDKPLAQLIDKGAARQFYRYRRKFDHKGTYGHALIVAGSYGKIGAAVLASRAAFRIGAGMVTACVPQCGYNILQTAIPEAMVITDKEERHLSQITLDFKPDAIGLGMGLGKNGDTVTALKEVFKNDDIPFVIDADALNILSENKKMLKMLPKQSILTPHPGELKRLLGEWKDDYDKLEKAKSFSQKHNVVLVIKGAYTITVFGDNLYINTSGNPGMATAGSGDALSGVITGLLAQGYDMLQAAIYGVFMHGEAGNLASEKLGYEAVMAGDIIENIASAYIDLFVVMNESAHNGVAEEEATE